MRRFGIEIEIGNEIRKKQVHLAIQASSIHDVYTSRYGLSNNNKYWHIKDDATCGVLGKNGPKGVEIASFIGHGNSDIEHIAEVASKLSQIGCKANHNCGLHIHAEAIDYTIQQCSVLVAHWIKLEKILSMALPIRRNTSEYCKFTFPIDDLFCKIDRNLKYNPESFWELICPRNLSFYENEDRRFNLNLVNFARSLRDQVSHRKTIELRWPEGTLDPMDIKCWTRLYLSLIENCKNFAMPENLNDFSLRDALCCLGLEDHDSFVILSKTMHDTKTWLLERIIRYEQDSLEFYGENKVSGIVQESKELLNKMWYPKRNYA